MTPATIKYVLQRGTWRSWNWWHRYIEDPVAPWVRHEKINLKCAWCAQTVEIGTEGLRSWEYVLTHGLVLPRAVDVRHLIEAVALPWICRELWPKDELVLAFELILRTTNDTDAAYAFFRDRMALS